MGGTRLRRQLIWTLLLVLVAIGGAGLATAADRPPSDESRPELAWRAEQRARPWLASMAGRLEALETELGTLAAAGREALVGLPALDSARIEAALAAGDTSSGRVGELVGVLAFVRSGQQAAVADSRLGSSSRAFLRLVDAAIARVEGLPPSWQETALHARRATSLLAALRRHDGLAFEATTAGREERFGDALELLAQAAAALADARAVRDELAAGADVATLDDLLRRYADYDAALVALYAEIERSGSRDSPAVRALLADVEGAQAALPPNNDALRIVVSEAAGPGVAEGLVEIEQVRGAVIDALAGLP